MELECLLSVKSDLKKKLHLNFNFTLTFTFFSNAVSSKNATSNFYVVDPITMDGASVSPSVVDLEQTREVIVTGTGFMDTSQIKCLFVRQNKNNKYYLAARPMDAVYQSSTQITCKIKPIKRSLTGYLVISFVKDKKRLDNLNVNTTLHRSVNMTSVTGGRFSDNLGSIQITFDGPIALLPGRPTCDDIFPQNSSSFGTVSKCLTRGSTLVAVLDGTTTTIIPGNVHVNLTQLRVRSADYTHYTSQTHVVNIEAPPNATAPLVRLVGPRKLGKLLYLC